MKYFKVPYKANKKNPKLCDGDCPQLEPNHEECGLLLHFETGKGRGCEYIDLKIADTEADYLRCKECRDAEKQNEKD